MSEHNSKCTSFAGPGDVDDKRHDTERKSPESETTAQLQCKEEEGDDADLEQHSDTDEFKEPACIICGVCGKTFTRIDTLRVHEKKHSAKTAQKCADCGKLFSTKRYLDMHMASKHSGAVYICSVEGCRKKFTNAHNFNLHSQAHEGKFKFICNHCGKGFMRKSSLNQHVTGHLGEKPHLCANCGKQFTILSSLTRHKESCGVSTRNFPCPVCNKQFKTERYLKEHALIHDKSNKYQCKICGEELSHRGTLWKHMQRKHNSS